MAVPSSQKAADRPIAFILENNGQVIASVTLVIRPEDLRRTEPALQTVTPNPSRGLARRLWSRRGQHRDHRPHGLAGRVFRGRRRVLVDPSGYRLDPVARPARTGGDRRPKPGPGQADLCRRARPDRGPGRPILVHPAAQPLQPAADALPDVDGGAGGPARPDHAGRVGAQSRRKLHHRERGAGRHRQPL